jgi:hypothetical protein
MRNRPTLWLTLGLLATSHPPVHGGVDEWGELKNRIGFSGRAAFNVKATFENLGGTPGTEVGPATGGFDHEYDDGYNRVDIQGNVDGATQYWGYDRASQVQGAGLVMSSTFGEANGRLSDVTNDPQWSAELTYARELGWTGVYWWGLVVGLSWQDLHFKESPSFASAGTRILDTYQLVGDPPPAPYRGSFDVPGPLLGDIPTRHVQTLPGAVRTAGQYELDATAYALRLGLLFETPFTDWLNLQFGGGVMGAAVHGEFLVRETTRLAEMEEVFTEARATETKFVGGAYGELGLSLRLSRGVHAAAGVQYIYLTDYTASAAGRTVKLDFGGVVAASLGMTFGF